MLDFPDRPTDEFKLAVLSHLRDNCAFEFQGSHSFSTQLLRFYPDTFLCRLVLDAGTRLKSGKAKHTLSNKTEYRFLFQPVLGDPRLLPLANDRSNILLANRWFGLKIRDDAERLEYAHFYYSVSRVERQREALNIPDSINGVRFGPTATEHERSLALGAMWRFLDVATRTSLAVKFEERGMFGLARYRAYVPAQLGNALYDVELKIWRRNGHITYNRSLPIFESPALEGVPLPQLGRMPLPGYIRWHERCRFYYHKAIATLGHATYAAAVLLFVLASIVNVVFLLEVVGLPLVRILLEPGAGLLGSSTWKVPLAISALYCVAYFASTTALILDVDTIRGTLLRWLPTIEGTKIDRLLYEVSRKQHRSERGYKPPLWKRLLWSGALLVFWSVYLIAVFTTLDTSLQKHVEPNVDRMVDVAMVLLEQALLYIPMVVYYAGWNFLDPQKLVILDPIVLSTFRLIIGLLVIRRIHRFWAATASAKLRVKTTAFRHKKAE